MAKRFGRSKKRKLSAELNQIKKNIQFAESRSYNRMTNIFSFHATTEILNDISKLRDKYPHNVQQHITRTLTQKLKRRLFVSSPTKIYVTSNEYLIKKWMKKIEPAFKQAGEEIQAGFEALSQIASVSSKQFNQIQLGEKYGI